ncbi:MAG: hypothetical protein V4621_07995 [Pseudomonadota bacterium]
MKTLTFVAIAMFLTGCSPMTAQKIATGFVDGLQSSAAIQQQQAARNQQLLGTMMQNNQPRRTDYQCVSNCTQGGYAYGLCQSKCTY